METFVSTNSKWKSHLCPLQWKFLSFPPSPDAQSQPLSHECWVLAPFCSTLEPNPSFVFTSRNVK